MFDNLRDLSDDGGIYDETPEDTRDSKALAMGAKVGTKLSTSRFMGLTAGQRFVLSILLLLAVVVMGSMCLLVLGKVTLF
jgi:hypothetical protein